MRALLILLLPLFFAGSAWADGIPTLAPDGSVSQRHDPGVAARDTTTPPRVAPPREFKAAGSTLGALRQLRDSNQISLPDFRSYRDEYKRDRAFASALRGSRRLDMYGVLGVVDRIAARGLLTPSRLKPLWLNLSRNREWWSSGPLLASGARVSFEGSELIFQYFPGEGLQFHPLANFGKLNGLWLCRCNLRLEQMLDELTPLAARRAGGIAWEYYFDFGGGAPPWVSSLAQGTAEEAMARAATRLGYSDLVFPLLKEGLAIFRTPPPSGVRVDVPGPGVHYVQYSFAPGLRIINGFVQSLIGLWDYAKTTRDAEGMSLFEAGDLRAQRELPSYDTGAWSLYDRGTDSHESSLNYHELLTDFLGDICKRTQTPIYCTTFDNFTRYLSEPPRVTVFTKQLRRNRSGRISYRLSKIARVGVQLLRGDKVVYSTSAYQAYGRHGLTVKAPKRAKRYDVRISATDLAGNSATYTATIRLT